MHPVGTNSSQVEVAGPNQNPSLGFTTLSNFVPSQVSTKVQRLFGPLSRTCSALPKPIKVVALLAGGIATVVALKRFYNMKSTNQNNAEKDLNTVASAVEGKTSLKNEGVELTDVKEDPSVSDSAQQATLENQLGKVLPTDLVETAQQQQNPSLGITDLPDDLLVGIFTNLLPKNQGLMAQTCTTFGGISKTAFLVQKQQVLSFLKTILKENFTPDIESHLVKTINFKQFSKVINDHICTIECEEDERFRHLLPKAINACTQLKDLSTIKLLHELLSVSPIFYLSHDFCSKIPQETVDRLEGMLIEKHGYEGTFLMFEKEANLEFFSHARKLLRYAHKKNFKYINSASNKLKDDKRFILQMIEDWTVNPYRWPQVLHAFNCASVRLKNDRDVVLAAVKKDSNIFSDVSEGLRGDKDIALAAVRQHGLHLEHASVSLRGDRDVVLAALQCRFRFYDMRDRVSPELQNDPEIAPLLLKPQNPWGDWGDPPSDWEDIL